MAKAAKKGTGTARGKSLSARLTQIDNWREQFNPLVGLVIARARALLEFGQRGMYADLQWTYKFVEERFPTLFALIERRTSPLLEMEWTVKQMEEESLPAGATPDMAAEQAKYLRECYQRIDNLEDAIEHLAMATFRGYAHLQKHDRDGDGEIDHLEVLDQWNFVRRGLAGNWWYNPDAQRVDWRGLPKANEIREGEQVGEGVSEQVGGWESGSAPTHSLTYSPARSPGSQSLVTSAATLLREDFIIREVKRPVGPIALMAFIRWSMGKKDWTAFIEIFGIPGGVVIGPPNVPLDKETEFQKAGETISEGGSGYLPNGSEYKPNDSPRGVNPFKDYQRDQQEEVVLAGTGGLLTMLTESGSGTLAGGAHLDTFNRIAGAEAKKISAVFQKDFDACLLRDKFDGQPVLAYFQIESLDETAAATLEFKRKVWSGFLADGTVCDILANQTDLKQLTKDVDMPVNAEYTDPYVPVETKTGALVGGETIKDSEGDVIGAATQADPNAPAPSRLNGKDPTLDANGPLRNRIANSQSPIANRARGLERALQGLLANAQGAYDEAKRTALQPLRNRLAEVWKEPDLHLQKLALAKLNADLPALLKTINASDESARVLTEAMSTAMRVGVEQGAENTKQKAESRNPE